MDEAKPIPLCFSNCGQKQMFLMALVASAVLTIAAPAKAQSIGVTPCDDYLTRYEACFPKMSSQAQATVRAMLDNMRTAWSNIAKDASQQAYLEGVCKKFMDNMKTKLETCSLP